MLVETLDPFRHHSRVFDCLPPLEQHLEVFDPEAMLLSLVITGVPLFAENRALPLLQSIDDAKAFDDGTSSNGSEGMFYAEDRESLLPLGGASDSDRSISSRITEFCEETDAGRFRLVIEEHECVLANYI